MSAKKLALELSINIKRGDITLEELNEQLAEAKAQMEEMGDDGSDEFKALGVVVDEAEAKVKSFNDELKDTKKGLDKTADAQKKAAQGSEVFKNGLKAVGTAFKALGIGIVVGALKFLFDALTRNQKVMNAFNTAVEAISIVMSKVVDTITDVVTQVYESSNGFEGLKNVIVGLLTIAITPLKLSFYQIKLALQVAQLAYEKSFFGGKGKDVEKIKELNESIKETTESIKQTGKDALEAGKDVVTNFGKAASEIGQVVTKTTEGIQKISIKGAIEQAKTNVELTNSAEVAAASQQLLLEKFDRQAEKLRQIRDEERNSIEVRKAANDELAKVLDDQEKAMLSQAALQVAAAQAQVNKNRNTETEVALIAALAEQAGVLAAVEGFRSEQKVNDLGLDREKQEQLKAISDSEAALSYERKKFNAEQIEDKLASLKAIKELEETRQQEEMLRLETAIESVERGTQAETDAIIALDEFREASRQANVEADRAIAEEKAARSKKEQEDDKKTAEQKVELAQSALTLVSGLADVLAQGDEEQQKKAFKLNKAASIGQAIINTSTGVSKAFAQGGVGGFITGATVAAAGLVQINKIRQTEFEGQGSVEAPPPLALGSGDVGTQPNIPNLNTSLSNTPTTKVIVTETDIRKATRDIDGIYNKAVVVE
ncbi:hypothetical protein N9265_00850 [bacterium]|nr:hypothetical protein [bacterium]